MGLTASSPIVGGGSGSLGSSGGDIIRRCNCYTVNNMSVDRKCYRHSLTFNTQGDKTSLSTKQKKKRNYGFATFKKKLIGKRRHCKGSDHGRYFREHFLDCPSDTLRALLAQYEALTLLKDLQVQADLARQPAMTLSQSLTDLYDSGECSDLVLLYRGCCIPVHRALLVARCPYLGRHVINYSENPAELHLTTPNYSVSIPILKRALKYLYSGSSDALMVQSSNLEPSELSAIALLQEEFGTPNSLESDISFLLESGNFSDCRLSFSSSSSPGESSLELTCHRTILAARSGFFRRLIDRRVKTYPHLNTAVMDIVLDGSIVPAKYGKLILHAMYHDILDMKLIAKDTPVYPLDGASSVTEAITEQSDDHAMNLFEIGRFLEFNFLSLSCEDLLMQNLSPSNVIKILNWSLKPHGSPWIARQTFLFLEEEFYTVANSDVLHALDQETLAKILQSDFLQASEAEILHALIRWGECQLNTKSAIGRDICGSNPSTTLSRRRDPKRREVCESELKEVLSPLFPYVRIPHILARDRCSEVLEMVRARNLFPVLPNFTSQISASTKFSPWDPRCTSGWFVRPRLFIPYYEECKKLIQDRCAPDPELISSSSPCVGHLRDTVYADRSRKSVVHDDSADLEEDENLLEFQSSKPPDKEMISKMLERFKRLLNSHSAQRLLSASFIDSHEALRLIELRVVREFSLPDNYVNILRKMRARNFMSEDLMSMSRCGRDVYESSLTNDWSFSQPDFLRPPGNEIDPHLGDCGPDVTLASFSALSLHEPDSPDLVSIEANSYSTLGKRFQKQSRFKRQNRKEITSSRPTTQFRRFSQDHLATVDNTLTTLASKNSTSNRIYL